MAGVTSARRCREHRLGDESRQRDAPRRPVRRLRLPRPVQAVREGPPRRHDQGGHRGLRRRTTRTSRSTWRPARAPTTSWRSRSASSRSSSREPQYFVDLNQYGAAALKSQWLPWKWQQSIAPNGAQIGLGTDVGSMGICYRRDLMQAAGLPTSRDGGLEALADVAGRTSTTGAAVREEGAEGHVLLRLGQQRLQRDDRSAQPRVLRRQGQRDRRARTRR